MVIIRWFATVQLNFDETLVFKAVASKQFKHILLFTLKALLFKIFFK